MAAALLAGVPPPALAAPPTPVHDALAMIGAGRDALAARWSYRQAVSGAHGNEQLAYDAGRPAGHRWRLLSVNGKPPTAAERRRLTAPAATAARKAGGPSLTGQGWLRHSHFELVGTKGGRLVYQIRPDPAAAAAASTRKLLRHLSGRLVIARSDHRPLELSLENFEAFSPRFGVTVHEFRFRARFKRLGANGPVVVTRSSSTVSGKVFWFKGFSDRTEVRLTDFAPATASAPAPATR